MLRARGAQAVERLREVIDFLASEKADLLILQEVDLNARRTHFLNVAEEIAQKLRMNYVFGREFQELTQGRPASPACGLPRAHPVAREPLAQRRHEPRRSGLSWGDVRPARSSTSVK